MLDTYDSERLASVDNRAIGASLEAGNIVFFPTCPIALPEESDLETLRAELPKQLKLKNVSFHPEAGHVRGIDRDADLYPLAERVLTGHSDRVANFLHNIMPELVAGGLTGTSSFRPIQEQGRNLKPHASNELVHIDAGAYGATNGDRILRFFVNVNPVEDRVWATKGTFPALLERYGVAAGVIRPGIPSKLEKGPLDHVRSGLLAGLARVGLPLARVLDSSPYDRLMRRFHNFMKDTPEFQANQEDHEELRFPPFSAWMVFTDMVSHASVSGQHALIHTSLVPLANCAQPEQAPINILANASAA
jgi:hypothetical protein